MLTGFMIADKGGFIYGANALWVSGIIDAASGKVTFVRNIEDITLCLTYRSGRISACRNSIHMLLVGHRTLLWGLLPKRPVSFHATNKPAIHLPDPLGIYPGVGKGIQIGIFGPIKVFRGRLQVCGLKIL